MFLNTHTLWLYENVQTNILMMMMMMIVTMTTTIIMMTTTMMKMTMMMMMMMTMMVTNSQGLPLASGVLQVIHYCMGGLEIDEDIGICKS